MREVKGKLVVLNTMRGVVQVDWIGVSSWQFMSDMSKILRQIPKEVPRFPFIKCTSNVASGVVLIDQLDSEKSQV